MSAAPKQQKHGFSLAPSTGLKSVPQKAYMKILARGGMTTKDVAALASLIAKDTTKAEVPRLGWLEIRSVTRNGNVKAIEEFFRDLGSFIKSLEEAHGTHGVSKKFESTVMKKVQEIVNRKTSPLDKLSKSEAKEIEKAFNEFLKTIKKADPEFASTFKTLFKLWAKGLYADKETGLISRPVGDKIYGLSGLQGVVKTSSKINNAIKKFMNRISKITEKDYFDYKFSNIIVSKTLELGRQGLSDEEITNAILSEHYKLMRSDPKYAKGFYDFSASVFGKATVVSMAFDTLTRGSRRMVSMITRSTVNGIAAAIMSVPFMGRVAGALASTQALVDIGHEIGDMAEAISQRPVPLEVLRSHMPQSQQQPQQQSP